MNVIDAAYATVHDYPGGSEALAPRLGMPAAVLRNKVNPNNPRNHLHLDEADKLIGISGDLRIVQALAASHDHALVGLDLGAGDDATVVSMVLRSATASGDLAQSIEQAMADGVITEREMIAIDAAGLANQRVIMRLVARLQAMAAQRPGAA